MARAPGDKVVAGTLSTDTSIRVRVEAVGDDTALAGIHRLVAEAQTSRSRAQALADRFAAMLFYVAAGAGLITFVTWQLLGNTADAVVRTVTVLVISCPHALALAIPLVISIGSAMGAPVTGPVGGDGRRRRERRSRPGPGRCRHRHRCRHRRRHGVGRCRAGLLGPSCGGLGHPAVEGVVRQMVQNLAWAAGYNIVAIPLAAGVLSGVGFNLPPAVGAVLMSASTIVVAANAQLLRRVDLNLPDSG